MRSATHRTPVMVRSTSEAAIDSWQRRGERQQRVVRRALEPARLVQRRIAGITRAVPSRAPLPKGRLPAST